ncbi:MAG: hypothetical protein L0Y72_08470 [Gemmataceae bacterium]|nr:hypothetical protein [Gemmataceae bacterium]
MPAVKVHWTRLSKPQFDDLRKRAEESERLAEFSRAHNEIVLALRDLDQAMTKGEPAYRTRKSGGEVRKWVHRFIAVSYAVFPEDQVAWVLKYQPVSSSWPD